MEKRQLLQWGFAGAILSSIAVGGISVALAAANSTPTAKQAFANRLQQQYAAAAAAPVATKPPAGYVPTFAACSPISLPSPGIDDSTVQVGPDSYAAFVTTNQWTGPVGSSATESYVVWAGVTGANASMPGVPAVVVDTRTVGSDGCSTQTAEVGIYTDLAASGPLKITSVAGGMVYLVARSGAPISLSLITHQYMPVP